MTAFYVLHNLVKQLDKPSLYRSSYLWVLALVDPVSKQLFMNL